MNGTRIGPFATSHTAIQTTMNIVQKAEAGGAGSMIPIAPDRSNKNSSRPSGTSVTSPNTVGQSFSQRNCMRKW